MLGSGDAFVFGPEAMGLPDEFVAQFARFLEEQVAKRAAAGDSGIVSVTIIFSRGDSSIRLIAGPESTPWTAHARMRSAPESFSATTAWLAV